MAATAWRCPYCKKTSETNKGLRKHIDKVHMDYLASKHLKKLATQALKRHEQNEKSKKAKAKSQPPVTA